MNLYYVTFSTNANGDDRNITFDESFPLNNDEFPSGTMFMGGSIDRRGIALIELAISAQSKEEIETIASEVHPSVLDDILAEVSDCTGSGWELETVELRQPQKKAKIK